MINIFYHTVKCQIYVPVLKLLYQNFGISIKLQKTCNFNNKLNTWNVTPIHYERNQMSYDIEYILRIGLKLFNCLQKHPLICLPSG